MPGAAAVGDPVAAPRGWAHSPQNRSPGSFAAPHVAQMIASGAAQREQNFRPALFSVPQLEQITASSPLVEVESAERTGCRTRQVHGS
jgi:hypothetical protein